MICFYIYKQVFWINFAACTGTNGITWTRCHLIFEKRSLPSVLMTEA